MNATATPSSFLLLGLPTSRAHFPVFIDSFTILYLLFYFTHSSTLTIILRDFYVVNISILTLNQMEFSFLILLHKFNSMAQEWFFILPKYFLPKIINFNILSCDCNFVSFHFYSSILPTQWDFKMLGLPVGFSDYLGPPWSMIPCLLCPNCMISHFIYHL